MDYSINNDCFENFLNNSFENFSYAYQNYSEDISYGENLSDMLKDFEHENIVKSQINTGPTTEKNKKETDNIENKIKENDETEGNNTNNIISTKLNINGIPSKTDFGNIIIEANENNNINNIVEINENKRGRRNNDEENSTPANHNKFSEDNIMRKNKAAINRFILDLLNNSIKNKNYKKTKFLPINTDMSQNLKIDLNLELLDRSIYDIFTKTELNNRHQKKGDWNKKLIEKICEEKTEQETIYILSLSYRDILEFIKNKKLNYILEKIRKKEEKSKNNKNFDLEKYMNKVKDLFINYEDWFKKRKGRKTEKNR